MSHVGFISVTDFTYCHRFQYPNDNFNMDLTYYLLHIRHVGLTGLQATALTNSLTSSSFLSFSC